MARRDPPRRVLELLKRDQRVEWAALAAILVLGVALRVHRVLQPIDYDEAYTVLHFALRSLGELTSDYSVPNNHILHSILVHLSIGLLGNSLWAARLPAFLAGVAAIPAVYVLSKQLVGRGWALGAAASVACAEHLVAYSANARGYSLATLLFLFAMIAGVRLVQRPSTPTWAVFVVSVAMSLYTTPTMLYGTCGLGVWLWIESARRQGDRTRSFSAGHLVAAMAIAGAITVLCYAPVLYRSGIVGMIGHPALRPVSTTPTTLALGLWRGATGTWRTWNEALPPAQSVLLTIGFIVSMAAWRRLSPTRIPPMIVLIGTAVLIVLAHRVVPFPRMWAFLLPVYFVSACAGLSLLGRTIATRLRIPALPNLGSVAALLAALWMAGGVETRTWAQFQNAERIDVISEFFRNHLRTGDVFAAYGYWATPIAYYLRQGGLVSRYFAGSYDTIEAWYLERQVDSRLARWWRESPAEVTADTRVLVLVRNDRDHLELRKLVGDLLSRGHARAAVAVAQFGSSTVYSLEPPDPQRPSP